MVAMIRALAWALPLATAPAAAQLSARDLAAAVARPAGRAPLPAALPFVDQAGRGTTLGAIAAGRPLVLLFADYTCRHVCGPGLQLTAAALAGTDRVPGRDYAFAVIGLDPRDGREAARAFAARIGPPGVRRAVRMLIGSPGTVSAAERALGYGVAYDAAGDQFAHDASVYVFGGDGRLAALLPELGLRPEPLRAALDGDAPTPGFADRIARLCYGLGAAHGRYGRPIALVLQLLAGLTVAGLAAVAFRLRGRRA